MATNAIRLQAAIEEYLATIRAAGMSRNTLKNKASVLRSFLGVVGDIYPRSLNVTHVDKFLRVHDHWQPSSRKKALDTVARFQVWCQKRKLMDKDVDIIGEHRGMKLPAKRRTRIPTGDYDRLLNIAGEQNPRNRVLVAMGLHLMCRAQELVSIRWRDVNLDDGEISIYRTKNGTYDELPITGDLREELVSWRRHVCAAMGVIKPEPDWYVACRYESPVKTGLPIALIRPHLRLNHPDVVVKKVLGAAGWEVRGEVMHMLRRSGARSMLDALSEVAPGDSAMRVVQSVLGHANQITTEKYVGQEHDRAKRNKLLKGRRLYGVGVGSAEVIPLKAVGDGNEGGADL